MIKVLSVFGTRPEAIKMAPVVREMEKHPDQIVSRVCVTAQHREMLDQVLGLFEIKPDYDLDLMRSEQTLSELTARILTALDSVIAHEKPDWVLVQGDTTTAMVASLVAFYHQVRVGHVEAGLRTSDKWRPFPEEINRRLAGILADLHFAPTERSRRNLLAEGISDTAIVVTGNTSIDALHWAVSLPFDPSSSGIDPCLWDARKRLLLVTAHRRENFGQPLENICVALREIAALDDQVHIVYPVHRNPNVQQPVYRLLSNISNITLLAPLPYLHMVYLMKHAYLILTDSGGIQEEAPSLKKPVLVLREVTERPEAVEAGTVRVVGTDPATIVFHTKQLLDDRDVYHQMAQAVNPYGDGHASRRIVDALIRYAG